MRSLFTYIEKVYVSKTLYLDTDFDQTSRKKSDFIATLNKVRMDINF